MQSSKYLVVVAGGQGTRMGSSTPKQFLTLGEKPILRRTIEKFLDAVPGIKTIVVLPEDHIPYWKKYCIMENFTAHQAFVPGGITRFHSVKNALGKVPDGAIVAIHDGVRPLISREMIRRMFREVEEGSLQGLIPVLPCTDTLKSLRLVKDEGGERLVDSGKEAPQRSEIWGAQTPQIFLSDAIKEAYRLPFSTSFTDDASVAREKGIPLAYCPGERFNIKITTPEDLILSEAILSMGKG